MFGLVVGFRFGSGWVSFGPPVSFFLSWVPPPSLQGFGLEWWFDQGFLGAVGWGLVGLGFGYGLGLFRSHCCTFHYVEVAGLRLVSVGLDLYPYFGSGGFNCVIGLVLVHLGLRVISEQVVWCLVTFHLASQAG